ncbi:hypothetical protein RFF05_08805 [Bengtsoniella intestinalis]|uniref:hypothetical protein n=1 Tax=Bengtsoniella intestinalis TaxID=3073143 RepID=UPI00391F9BBC
MVKGIARRVVVIDVADQHFFEQAIFIVRNGAVGEGVSSQDLVEEARRVAETYTGTGTTVVRRLWTHLAPVAYGLCGASATALAFFYYFYH